ncbi:hypothetical protein I3760_01G108200 [Carya illinoinensis]|nr:hypothetical protein I3760_01G108200 [Carya illinoinensis]
MDDDFEFPTSSDVNMDEDMGIPEDDPVNSILKEGAENEIGKNELKKKLVKEGEGWETPSVGDEVEVHYTGTLLDGTQFDSSRDSGTSFKFKLGQVGLPPSIPPNAILQFDVELLSWTNIKDICKDGRILKKILTQGEKWENPEDLDEVFVKYEARLEDGTLISKSDGVEFNVGNGYFCLALSKSMKTMKKGEKVLLIVKPQYAFGESGRPASGDEGDVPPNTSPWKAVSDITKDKKVLWQEAIMKLIGKLDDGTIFTKKGHEEEPFEFKVNEEQVVDGLDRAVKKMKKGEVALVTIQPEYAFEPSETQQELAIILANVTVDYEVELLSFVKDKESWEMNTQEKIEAAGKKKEEGNALVKATKYERASKRYQKAVRFIDHDSSFSDEEKKQAKVLKITCNLNNAACKVKLKYYKQAERLCTKVSCIQLVDLDLAELDIKKALEIDPDNRDVKLEYKILKEKVREYNKKDAQFYGTIFLKMNKLEQARLSISSLL